MAFEQEPEYSAAEAEDIVERTIEQHEVALFMKGTPMMPQCGYSRKAIKLLQLHRDDVETVDILQATEQFRAALKPHSGRETIPQAFVDGEFVGGSDILEQLHEQDDLADTLNA